MPIILLQYYKNNDKEETKGRTSLDEDDEELGARS
jgi:hypothetical protein